MQQTRCIFFLPIATESNPRTEAQAGPFRSSGALTRQHHRAEWALDESPLAVIEGFPLMRDWILTAEAEECRLLAVELADKAEAPFLRQLVSEFDDLNVRKVRLSPQGKVQ
jgi:hypothetical protein